MKRWIFKRKLNINISREYKANKPENKGQENVQIAIFKDYFSVLHSGDNEEKRIHSTVEWSEKDGELRKQVSDEGFRKSLIFSYFLNNSFVRVIPVEVG